MAEWYFKVDNTEILTPDKLTMELYPTSDLIRLANYDMTGKFKGVSIKFGFNYENILESDRKAMFDLLMGWDAQNAWQKGARKLYYRLGSEIRTAETYTGAMNHEFANNFMGAVSDNWLWESFAFNLIQRKAIDNELYQLPEV